MKCLMEKDMETKVYIMCIMHIIYLIMHMAFSIKCSITYYAHGPLNQAFHILILGMVFFNQAFDILIMRMVFILITEASRPI